MNYAVITIVNSIQDYAKALASLIEEKDRVIEKLSDENTRLKELAKEIVNSNEQFKWTPFPDEYPKMNGTFEVTYKTEDYKGDTIYAVTDAYWTGTKWEKDFEEFEDVIAFAPQRKPYTVHIGYLEE